MQRILSMRNIILIILFLVNAAVIAFGLTGTSNTLWWLLFTLPIAFVAVRDACQREHAVLRNYPLVGHLRYFFEAIRPELRQYFFESDLDGKPFNRRQRSIVYQRAKNEKQTVAFGMQANPTAPGYEWMSHSLYPVTLSEKDLRVHIGNEQCLQPYYASILNIGAMSYGALSKTAIQSLNEGAKIGGFAHNTGEGGISQYHLSGGDLIWQIGTGYFGCRDAEGRFSSMAYRKNALRPEVKMIELKLSQGAKPGHGGILPAAKNTPEIAAIRHVIAGTTVHSPAQHAEFDSPEGLVLFLQLLRELSEGKPVGFKLCIGDKQEFIDICQAIATSGIVPDFIAIDGAEGGTGAAPLEFTDHLGMPLYEAIAFARQTLDSFQLSAQIKLIAAGKVITGFDVLKVLALGASACYSARGMMMALGCIQALACDSGKCPVGVATQDPRLYKGLHPADKRARVANYHRNTMVAIKELMEACGFKNTDDIDAKKFFRRISEQETKSYKDIYLSPGNFLNTKRLPFLN
ncbi:MAG: FMN-binding glutamate synthase family protein [Chitinophagaceae bacterium]|nr:MAG: FMN-binding glutamate synthase family protein [Chitinophagaceae bacterium]